MGWARVIWVSFGMVCWLRVVSGLVLCGLS